MSICANISELARELRTAAGTVLSIVGSRLEADARARVDEVGPQWLTEFEEQRDHLEPGECTCVPCPLRDEDVCDEAEADEDYLFTTTWADYRAKKSDQFEAVMAQYGLSDSSAADSAAADPSPTVPSPSPASVGGEGRKEDSCILPPASFRHPTDPGEVSAPSPGEQVREDDLAAHIMGDFVSGQDVDPLTATLIDALSSRIASALLTDFTITRRA